MTPDLFAWVALVLVIVALVIAAKRDDTRQTRRWHEEREQRIREGRLRAVHEYERRIEAMRPGRPK